jgi:acetyltransferase-like isoleucine patch superfamily enzyme
MKALLKAVADAAALLAVSPVAVCYLIGRSVLGTDKAFSGWSQAFALVPGLSGVYLRRAFYRVVLSRCEYGCCISFGTVISHSTAEIGRNVYVGVYGCLGDVTLDEDVLLGSHVSVINGKAQHGIDRIDLPIREQPGVWPRVTIGRDSWIGDRAVVLADVGRHCVIGAGSVVTRPIPDYAIAVGNPARVIRFRDQLSECNGADSGDLSLSRHASRRLYDGKEGNKLSAS